MARGNILIVDDSIAILESLRSRLVRHGYDVAIATTVAAAAKSIDDRDVVIVDFHMSPLNGPDFLAALRKIATPKAESLCRYFLYTSDKTQGAHFRQYGFDGVYACKGDFDALTRQLDGTMRNLAVMQALKQVKG